MKKILPLFSYLFHPIFIPLLGTIFYLLFNQSYYTFSHYFLLIFQIIIITILLPLSFFYLLRTFGKVDSVMLSDTSQRKIPLLLQIALTIVLINQSITVDRFEELYYFFLAGLLSTIIAYLLLFATIKSSIHMIGISAVTFFVIGLSIHNQVNVVFTIASLFVLNGIIGSSRLYMNAHSVKELILGFFIGMLPQISVWYFWL